MFIQNRMNAYDKDKNGYLDSFELKSLMGDLNDGERTKTLNSNLESLCNDSFVATLVNTNCSLEFFVWFMVIWHRFLAVGNR